MKNLTEFEQECLQIVKDILFGKREGSTPIVPIP